MGANVNRHEVVLTPEHAKLAGFAVALCRYLGPRQQAAISQEMTRGRLRFDRRLARIGPRGSSTGSSRTTRKRIVSGSRS